MAKHGWKAQACAAGLAMAFCLAGGKASAATSDRTACEEYIVKAEALNGIPKGLLLSISHIESGLEGKPWPWTLNIDEKPYYFRTMAEAVAAMRGRDGRMHQRMAVGCMQLYVKYHGDAFNGPAHMIDPASNVFYAARFLADLHAKTNNWTEAVQSYHSSLAEPRKSYACMVMNRSIAMGYAPLTRAAVNFCSGRHMEELMRNSKPIPPAAQARPTLADGGAQAPAPQRPQTLAEAREAAARERASNSWPPPWGTPWTTQQTQPNIAQGQARIVSIGQEPKGAGRQAQRARPQDAQGQDAR